jgi:hypothetical protein
LLVDAAFIGGPPAPPRLSMTNFGETLSSAPHPAAQPVRAFESSSDASLLNGGN